MNATRREPILLTPGPLTTSSSTKAAMLRDFGSRDPAFTEMNREVRRRLLALAHAESTHVCVPVQGSGTFAVEATIGTLVPRKGKALVLVNGAYGERMATICERLGRACAVLSTPEHLPHDAAAVDAALARDETITHVAAVHCETTAGLVNPVAEIAAVASRHGRGLLIDAMSSFGALELDARTVRFDALVASANKCLEGVPGVAFALIRRPLLEDSAGNAPSLALDLFDQWRSMEDNGQWRFTPPTHVIAALHQALIEHSEEGGTAGRGARYAANCTVLVEGMRRLGFRTLLADDLQAPIIVTFHTPSDPRFRFQTFYDGLATRGFIIYPGKLTGIDTFRIGCIGRVDGEDMRAALDAVRDTLDEMGVGAGPGLAAGPTRGSPTAEA